MIRYSELVPDEHGNMVEVNVREIPYTSIRACPHFIMVSEHYGADNRCRCTDPTHAQMVDWGYTWDRDAERWLANTGDDDAT